MVWHRPATGRQAPLPTSQELSGVVWETLSSLTSPKKKKSKLRVLRKIKPQTTLITVATPKLPIFNLFFARPPLQRARPQQPRLSLTKMAPPASPPPCADMAGGPLASCPAFGRGGGESRPRGGLDFPLSSPLPCFAVCRVLQHAFLLSSGGKVGGNGHRHLSSHSSPPRGCGGSGSWGL